MTALSEFGPALKPFDPAPAVDASARGLARMIKDYGIECPLVQKKLTELTS